MKADHAKGKEHHKVKAQAKKIHGGHKKREVHHKAPLHLKPVKEMPPVKGKKIALNILMQDIAKMVRGLLHAIEAAFPR